MCVCLDEVTVIRKEKQQYSRDFYAWAIQNAKLLRDGKLSEIDVENIAEEIESMGKSEKRELINRLAVLIAHLMKWDFQPEKRSNSWRYTIEEQRNELQELLDDSPSLGHKLEEKLPSAFKRAVLIAAVDTGIKKSSFPKSCQYTLKQILSQKFFPDQ